MRPYKSPRPDRTRRLLLFFIVAVVHIIIILFLTVNIATTPQTAPETARVMRVTDLAEIPQEEEYIPPPPPRPPPPPVTLDVPVVEAIAETMIETDYDPDQIIGTPGSISDNSGPPQAPPRVSVLPHFDERIMRSVIGYPLMAQRLGIEGQVLLELFVDRDGIVQQVTLLRETPEGRGFGEAAVRGFTGRQGTPAYDSYGNPVSHRFRYPVRFTLR